MQAGASRLHDVAWFIRGQALPVKTSGFLTTLDEFSPEVSHVVDGASAAAPCA